MKLTEADVINGKEKKREFARGQKRRLKLMLKSTLNENNKVIAI